MATTITAKFNGQPYPPGAASVDLDATGGSLQRVFDGAFSRQGQGPIPIEPERLMRLANHALLAIRQAAILLAWESGDLSEMEAAKALSVDVFTVRGLRGDAIATGIKGTGQSCTPATEAK